MMRVENLPPRVDRQFYQDAIEAYLAGARDYARSVYLAGNIRFPGLSDLDLLVVPEPRYLAPLHLRLRGRVPERFHAIVEHDPFIVPEVYLPVIRYAFISNLTWLHGEKLPEPLPHDASPASNLACAIEHLYNLDRFLQQQRTQPVLDATSANRICNSLRFTLQRLQALGLWEDASQYGARMDEQRAQLLETRAEACALSLFETFAENLVAAMDRLHRLLDTDVRSPAQIEAFYQRETYPIPGLRQTDLRLRQQAIRQYLAGLAARNFSYGTIFHLGLHPDFSVSLRFRLLAKLAQGWRRLRAPRPPAGLAADRAKRDFRAASLH
ncbi:MAG: hypothetical protein ACRD2Q_06345 [Terriglobales bacterium]